MVVVVVTVVGLPSLTRALRGRYSEVLVTGGGRQIGEMAGASLGARLSNVHLSARELLGRRADELPCERVEDRSSRPTASSLEWPVFPACS